VSVLVTRDLYYVSSKFDVSAAFRFQVNRKTERRTDDMQHFIALIQCTFAARRAALAAQLQECALAAGTSKTAACNVCYLFVFWRYFVQIWEISCS